MITSISYIHVVCTDGISFWFNCYVLFEIDYDVNLLKLYNY